MENNDFLINNPIVDDDISNIVDDPSVEVPVDGFPMCAELTPETPVVPEEPVDIENPLPCAAVTIGSFFGTIQESVTIIWQYHLKTRKHHIHVALNEFYTKALDVVDDIIEQYQGINGICEEPFTNTICSCDKSEVDYLKELKGFVNTNKNLLGGVSELESTLDEFLALIDSTLYKITAFCENTVLSYDQFCYENQDSIQEACRYNQFGERSCDDPDDDDYDPNYDDGEEEE